MAAAGFKFRWNGDELRNEVRQKSARAAYDLATTAAEFSKEIVAVGRPGPPQYDKHPGTLKRSITVGAPNDSHVGDEVRAIGGEDLLVTETGTARDRSLLINASLGSPEQHVELGSWVAYACVEEVRQPYIYPGVELMRSLAEEIVIEAFHEGEE